MTSREIILELEKQITNLSITNYSISHSSTNFGESSYMYVNGMKIRASDHSTGVRRMIEEVALFEINFNSVLQLIERISFPGRYTKMISLEFGDAFEMKKEKLDTLNCEYEVIESISRISKRGFEMSIIRKRNKEIVHYVKNN